MEQVSECPLCGSNNINGFERFRVAKETRNYFLCENCNLVFMRPEDRLSADEERRRYKLHNNQYEDERYRLFLNQTAGAVSASCSPGQLGLDYGCGPEPVLAQMLNERGFKVNHFDPLFFPSETCLDTQYDFVSCTEVIEHAHEPHKLLSSLVSCVAGNGRIFIMTGLRKPESAFSKWWYTKDPTHVGFYSEYTLQFIAQAFGLSIERYSEQVTVYTKNAQ